MKMYLTVFTILILLLFLIGCGDDNDIDKISFTFNDNESFDNIKSNFEITYTKDITDIMFDNEDVLVLNDNLVIVNRLEDQDVLITLTYKENDIIKTYHKTFKVIKKDYDLSGLFLVELNFIRNDLNVGKSYMYYYFDNEKYVILTSETTNKEELTQLNEDALLSLYDGAVKNLLLSYINKDNNLLTISFQIGNYIGVFENIDINSNLIFKIYEDKNNRNTYIELSLEKLNRYFFNENKKGK